MQKSEMQRLVKVEDRIHQIATEDFGLKYCPIEFDIIPPQKMLEIMSYHMPTNISNWKYGRDYERLRTIYENGSGGLPYEVVINSDPSRAYLMKENTFAVQILVIAHVVGHVNFFTENRHFRETRKDIVELMAEANRRFNKYERMYGQDEVEAVVDAGHALQLHSSPFETETAVEKFERIYKQKMLMSKKGKKAQFNDLVVSNKTDPGEDIHLFNQQLKRYLKLQTPIEPTEDILRYIIDNSPLLEDWHKDILEVLRVEGQYYWPQMKTKYMNEGWATFWHEKILGKLFKEGLLSVSDHAQYNYSNSLVKALNPGGMNPYLIGCGMWEDVEERWDKGRHGPEYENCTNKKEKEEWDTKEGNGRKKMFEAMRTQTDWFFMQNFLTAEVVDKLKLYIYSSKEEYQHIDYVITAHEAKEIAQIIINSFAHSGIPKIEIVNGNMENTGTMMLEHRWSGANLDKKYSEETLKHIWRMWGRPVVLNTMIDDKAVTYKVCSKDQIQSVKMNTDPQVSMTGDLGSSGGPRVASSKGYNPMESTNYVIIEEK